MAYDLPDSVVLRIRRLVHALQLGNVVLAVDEAVKRNKTCQQAGDVVDPFTGGS